MSDRIILISVASGPGSGAERVLEYLLHGADDILRKRLVVVAPLHSSVMETARHLDYATVEWPRPGVSSFRGDTLATWRVFRVLRDFKPALIHSWHTRSFEFVAVLGRMLHIPCTGTLHDHPEAIGYSHLRHLLIRWGAHQMNGVVCVSHALREACLNVGWKSHLHLIHNGLPDISPPKLLPPSRRQVAFLGCSERWKGFEMVWKLAERGVPGIDVWNLYGDLTSASHPLLKSNRTEWPSSLRFHGRLPIDKILLDNAIVFHPSERFDPYPTVLLEAARGGRVAISSRVGGAQEIVTHEKTGMLFDPGDARQAESYLTSILQDSSRLEQMAGKARARYEEKFRIESMVAGYKDFWNSFRSRTA